MTRPLKYHNIPTVVDGIKFASKKEAKRWGELSLLQKAGAISHLGRQLVYRLVVNGVEVGEYWADFSYWDFNTGTRVVEDVKSSITRKNAVYRLKKKLMLACHGITILET